MSRPLTVSLVALCALLTLWLVWLAWRHGRRAGRWLALAGRRRWRAGREWLGRALDTWDS